MDITFYKATSDSIIQVDPEIKLEDWSKKLTWIDIRQENRKEVSDYFRKQDVFNDLLDCIEYPDKYALSNTFGNAIIINLPVSDSHDIYKAEYISLIFEEDVLITIIQKGNDIINERTLSTYSSTNYSSFSTFLFYILVLKILAQSNDNMSIARKRLHHIEKQLTQAPEDLSSKELLSCEQDVNQLSDIIEDQYVGFETLASFSSLSHGQEDKSQMNKIIKGFEPLDKAMVRLEKRAESVRLHYMLLQQEESTKKINVLTIVQAIFVPLTFVAGVYGMNFISMPELNWSHGYLYVWLLFIAMASGLIIYFYRKGWFD